MLFLKQPPPLGGAARPQVAHTGSASALSTDTTSYAPPVVAALAPSYGAAGVGPNGGGFATAGGEPVTLTGINFGPLGTAVAATYRLPDVGSGGAGYDGGATLGGSLFQAANCTVTIAHVEVCGLWGRPHLARNGGWEGGGGGGKSDKQV